MAASVRALARALAHDGAREHDACGKHVCTAEYLDGQRENCVGAGAGFPQQPLQGRIDVEAHPHGTQVALGIGCAGLDVHRDALQGGEDLCDHDVRNSQLQAVHGVNSCCHVLERGQHDLRRLLDPACDNTSTRRPEGHAHGMPGTESPTCAEEVHVHTHVALQDRGPRHGTTDGGGRLLNGTVLHLDVKLCLRRASIANLHKVHVHQRIHVCGST
mmetsp:Transcript_137040/g.382102  ORF Transcript_137040/g.382102 Transcript_137040/m.382102 type:complete len:216 (-) Transcript_137040:386-1033(-)